MSITDEAARKIYELTKASGGTVPGWIREAAMERLLSLGFNGSKKRKGRRSSQSETRAGGNAPGGGES